MANKAAFRHAASFSKGMFEEAERELDEIATNAENLCIVVGERGRIYLLTSPMGKGVNPGPAASPGRAGEFGVCAGKMDQCGWVKPKVAFVEWTDAGHLRHCTFLAMRDDKRPAEVVRET